MMERFVIRGRPPLSTTSDENCLTKKMRIEFSEDDIIHDPANRKPIDSYHPNIRDQVRMAYLLKGACQPMNHIFTQRLITGELRIFNPEWFDRYVWLDYSASSDQAYCLCCYLLKNVVGSQSFLIFYFFGL